MLTNIDIDEALIAEAMALTGARTKREAVDRALREMVARAKRPRFRDFFGIGGIDPAYDPKASAPEDFGKGRIMEPESPYATARPSRPAEAKARRKR
ncbi:type II toxin-antitoxin system VapB family antitoxin [Ramlibacter sp.]|uniref:type II toxin-antitoxin system VapB family antitoxin n=1 Tax=Ramlibacter sp. TaxID=1917967 RepID=UPI0035B191B7